MLGPSKVRHVQQYNCAGGRNNLIPENTEGLAARLGARSHQRARVAGMSISEWGYMRNIQIYLDICVSIRNFELSLEGRMHLGNKNKMDFILYFARFK